MSNDIRIEPSEFNSAGVRCMAELHLPADVVSPPVVVMAHGFGSERRFRLPAYAEHFARHGLAVLLFDYRTFGDSDGTPRNLVDPDMHVTDWKAAIAHARTLTDVDYHRLALWGTSYSGGHAIVCAAADREIRAIVAQVPFVDPFTSIARSGLWHLLRATPHGLFDVIKARLGMDPHYVKLADHPGGFAALNTAESLPGLLSIVPDQDNWDNRVCARILFKFPMYRPLRFASGVHCPAMLMLAENDSLIAPSVIRKAAKQMTNAQVAAYPCGHFDIYHGEFFSDAIGKQTRFLQQHLLV